MHRTCQGRGRCGNLRQQCSSPALRACIPHRQSHTRCREAGRNYESRARSKCSDGTPKTPPTLLFTDFSAGARFMGGPLALTISSHTIQTRPAPWDRVNPLHAVTRFRRRGRRRGSQPPLARILDDRDCIAHAEDEASSRVLDGSAHLLRCAHVSRINRATRGAERPVESSDCVLDRGAPAARTEVPE